MIYNQLLRDEYPDMFENLFIFFVRNTCRMGRRQYAALGFRAVAATINPPIK